MSLQVLQQLLLVQMLKWRLLSTVHHNGRFCQKCFPYFLHLKPCGGILINLKQTSAPISTLFRISPWFFYTQPVQTLFFFKSIWIRPQRSQGCQKIRFFFSQIKLLSFWANIAPKRHKLNFCTFSVWGCWGQPMLLFWKLVLIIKISTSQNFKTTFNYNLILSEPN